MTKMWTMIALAGSLALAAPADAQRRGNDNDRNDDIPKAYIPPPGMCRIWLDGVPAGQQPAPTDCKTALRNKPAKARVVFGDDYVDRDKRNEPTLKGFQGRDRNAPPNPGKGSPWRRP